MKRVIAIWLLLLYAQVALGISFDSCACGSKQVKVVLLRLTTSCTLCGGDPLFMACCQTETTFGKADQHKLPVSIELSTPSKSLEKMSTVFCHLQPARFDAAWGIQPGQYDPKRSLPSRMILSLVQSFRI